MSHKFGSLICMALVLALAGCGGKKDKDGADGDKTAVVQFNPEAAKLEFNDEAEVPPLDNGRLNIKVLKNWKETNQKRDGMMFIYFKEGKASHSLIVYKPDDVKGDVKELDAANKSGYLTSYTEELPDHYKKAFTFKPKLIDINGRPWILYSVGMKSGQKMIDTTFLTTVANGRKYTVELRTPEKTANQEWPALLTMASGMTFTAKPADPMTPESGKTDTANNAIVGEWTKDPVENDPYDDYIFEIKADGTFRHWTKKKGANKPVDDMKGTWKMKNDKLIEIELLDQGVDVKLKAELLDPNTIDMQFVELENSGGVGPGKLKRKVAAAKDPAAEK